MIAFMLFQMSIWYVIHLPICISTTCILHLGLDLFLGLVAPININGMKKVSGFIFLIVRFWEEFDVLGIHIQKHLLGQFPLIICNRDAKHDLMVLTVNSGIGIFFQVIPAATIAYLDLLPYRNGCSSFQVFLTLLDDIDYSKEYQVK